jgi:preprotein translocase subunit SecY
MLKTFFRKLGIVARDRGLLRKLGFILLAFAAFRVLAAIPVPGADATQLAAFFADSQIFAVLNLFSGGGLSALSVVALGVGPYITASIILQLATLMFPRLKEMYHEEGQTGRRKFAQYSRIATVPLAAVQGLALLKLLESQGVLPPMTTADTMISVLAMVAGSVLLMWIGELVSEFGAGNGVSVLIFAGIVAGLPSAISQLEFAYDPSQLPSYLAFGAIALVAIAGVVAVTEAERPIPIAHARQVLGAKSAAPTFLPIRVNQAGVMPIIFALSILLVPQLAAQYLSVRPEAWLAEIGRLSGVFMANQLYYGLVYFLLVVLFTFFYTAVTFEPDTISKNLQRQGAFVPGVRPGEATAEHVGKIVTRTTAIGAIFLGVIAVLPLIGQYATGIQAVTVGGTSMLIVVNVVTDLLKKFDGQITMREYR